jgi:uncharacterized protein
VNRLWTILGLLWCFCASAAEVIPPAPARYFNDYANVVSSATASRLNQTLEDFERATSSQIIVAVFPKMQTDSSIDDYTVRVARAWKVGQKDKNNGAVLFVFVQDHKMFIQVGYGLEGALPDGLCKRIIGQEIAPRFKQGDFDGGLSAGVTAMIAATKGEYKGTGRTVADNRGGSSNDNGGGVIVIVCLIFAVIILLAIFSKRSGGPRGGGWLIISGGGGWSGGGGGGFSGGGGGGFSGGGGSFGGGGAGGSW